MLPFPIFQYVTHACFRVNQLKRDQKKYQAEIDEIVQEFEQKIANSALEINKDRQPRYFRCEDTSLLTIRSHVYSCMVEDITLAIIEREKNLQLIKEKISELDQSTKYLQSLSNNSVIHLGKVLAHQTHLKEKIKDISVDQIPAHVQAGVEAFAMLSQTVTSAATLLIAGGAYLISVYDKNKQQSANKKINRYSEQFLNEEKVAEILKSSLSKIDQELQHNFNIKNHFTVQSLQYATGSDLLRQVKIHISGSAINRNNYLVALEKQTRARNKKESERAKKAEEYRNATGRKKDELREELDVIIAEMSILDLDICKLNQSLSDTESYLSKLQKIYEQELPLAGICEWFNKYQSNFYNEPDTEKLEALLRWRKSIKEHMNKAQALHSELDSAITGLVKEVSALIAPLQAMGLRKIPKYLMIGTQTMQFGYGGYRAVENFIIGLKAINAGRYQKNELGEIVSAISFLGSMKKMGWAFAIENFVTPGFGMVNSILRFTSAIFGLNWFRNPVEVLIERLSKQILQGIENLSIQIRNLREEMRIGFVDTKSIMLSIESKVIENASLLLAESSRIDDIMSEYREQTDLSQLSEFTNGRRRITDAIVLVQRLNNNAYLCDQLLTEVKFACDERFVNLTLTQKNIIFNPFDAIQYIVTSLSRLDATLKIPLNEIPNYRIMAAILMKINDLNSVKDTDFNKITKILSYAKNLDIVIQRLKSNGSWLVALVKVIVDDLKILQNKLNELDIGGPIYDKEKCIDDATVSTNNEKEKLKFEQQNSFWLQELTKRNQNIQLYYHHNYNSKKVQKYLADNAIIIVDLKGHKGKPYAIVRYVKNREFIVSYAYHPLTKSKFNHVIELADVEAKIVASIAESAKKSSGKYQSDKYEKIEDKSLLNLIDKLLLVEEYHSSNKQSYYFILQWMLRCFQYRVSASSPWLLERDRFLSQVMTYFPKNDGNENNNSIIAAFLKHSPRLIFDINDMYRPLFVSEALLRNFTAFHINARLKEAENFGFEKSTIKYRFEKINNSYIFSLLFVSNKENKVYVNSEREMYAFNEKFVESQSSIYDFLLAIFYACDPVKNPSSDISPCSLLGTIRHSSRIMSHHLNLYSFSAKFPDHSMKYSHDLFTPMHQQALMELIETVNLQLVNGEPDNNCINGDTLYLYLSDNKLMYVTVTSNEIVRAQIECDEQNEDKLKPIFFNSLIAALNALKEGISLNIKEEDLRSLFKITSTRGHTPSLIKRVTNILTPYLQINNTLIEGKEFIPLQLSLEERRSNRYRRLLALNESRAFSNVTLKDILVKILTHYELLIASIRLVSDHDYETAVALINENLLIPHLSQIDVLFAVNIDLLKDSLKKIPLQIEWAKWVQLCNCLIAQINLLGRRNISQERLIHQIEKINVRIQDNPSVLPLSIADDHNTLATVIEPNAHYFEYQKIHSQMKQSRYQRQAFIRENNFLRSHQNHAADESSLYAGLSKKLLFFTDQLISDFTAKENHHYNIFNIKTNLFQIKNNNLHIHVVGYCIREDMISKLKKHSTWWKTHVVTLFAVLNNFHWSLLAIHYDQYKNSVEILWKDAYRGSELEEEELAAIKQIYSSANNFHIQTINTKREGYFCVPMYHTGPIVLQGILDVCEEFKTGQISLFKVNFKLNNVNKKYFDDNIEQIRVQHRHDYSRYRFAESQTKKINASIDNLLLSHAKEIIGEVFELPLFTAQVFVDNLLQLLWQGASFESAQVYTEAYHKAASNETIACSQSSLPSCQDSSRAFARMLSNDASYKHQPTFFRNGYVHKDHDESNNGKRSKILSITHNF